MPSSHNANAVAVTFSMARVNGYRTDIKKMDKKLLSVSSVRGGSYTFPNNLLVNGCAVIED